MFRLMMLQRRFYPLWGQQRPAADPGAVRARVRSCVLSHPKVDRIVGDDSHFQTDFGLDSLDHVELVMAIEDEFKCDIGTERVQSLVSVNALVEYLCHMHDATPDMRRVPPIQFVPNERPPKVIKYTNKEHDDY